MKTPDPSPTALNSTERTVGTFRVLQVVLVVSALIATLFTAWTPLMETPVFSLGEENPLVNWQATAPPSARPTVTPRPGPVIGLVIGHWGDDNDPGAVCDDGYTEFQSNETIAYLVREGLSARGMNVILLKEFDSQLNGFHASALISIHADSCTYVNDQATGYKVASALSNPYPELSARLTACLRSRYGGVTGLPLHSTSITDDMTSYHAFSEISQNTPAAIIETGFLNLDRQLLEQQPEKAAQGIIDGIVCFIYNEDVAPQSTQASP